MHSDRRLSEQLSAREISRSPEVRCDGPAPVEARERSLTASAPFPLALAGVLLSFLHIEPDFRDSIFATVARALVARRDVPRSNFATPL